ncbi:MAG: hypothetical protein ACXV7C_09210 [Candidatus Angelobacter sp.]
MLFNNYIGIDYSGAEVPTAGLKGLRIYEGDTVMPPREVAPPPSPRRYWTRREIAEWLVANLSVGPPSIVGIDHGFSFPLRYFQEHHLPLDWPLFLDDFQQHWPTDEDHTYVDFVRDGLYGNAAARSGDSRWRRLTELHARTAKSVFHFDVPGAVAKSTHAGLPWLRYLRQHLGSRVHFWPFDGWQFPPNTSVIAEVYPALWNKGFPSEGRTADQQDAFAIAEWLRRADIAGTLSDFLCPVLAPADREIAKIEGWILGIVPVLPWAALNASTRIQ